MARTKSPFKDNEDLKEDIQKFLNTHRSTFAQEIDRTSAYFELAVYNDVIRFYETSGYVVTPQNLKPRKRQFVYALSPNAKPENCSYFHVVKQYKRKPDREFEVRHNVRIQSKHDERVFVSPDYAVIEPGSITSTKVRHYYYNKADYFYVKAIDVVTFAETKHYNPGPELVLNFVGLVNEIMPDLMTGKKPTGLPKHFGPALFVSGVGNSHIRDIKESLMERYGINVLLGLFAYPSQLYAARNQGFIEKIGSKKC
jgi:hypothetical protein